MRKLRDYDADLKALAHKARQLKTRKQSQLGELVMATGADALGVEELAGALLHAAGTDAATREAWRKRGAAFFRGERKGAGDRTGREPGGTAAGVGDAEQAPGEAGAV
ncbi:conjugal transfer protein TraD [Sphingomonas sp.]|uniref:conjugal transfer protein TraD n=1 Tax=Sphingomonas sp. TaxID=28214 RepID=UPI002FD94A77